MAVVVAVAALAVFVLGAIMTVLVVAAWAIRHEDRRFTPTRQAPSLLSSGVRRVMGVGLRDVDAQLKPLPRSLLRLAPDFGGDDARCQLAAGVVTSGCLRRTSSANRAPRPPPGPRNRNQGT